MAKASFVAVPVGGPLQQRRDLARQRVCGAATAAVPQPANSVPSYLRSPCTVCRTNQLHAPHRVLCVALTEVLPA